MAAKKVKVLFTDGHEEIVKVLPLAQVQTEEHMGGLSESNNTRYNYYLAWSSLKQANKESRDFLTWLPEVEDYEVVDEPEAVPTPEAQSSDTSST